MKRKRFEKLMISQHKSQARDIQQAVRTIIASNCATTLRGTRAS